MPFVWTIRSLLAAGTVYMVTNIIVGKEMLGTRRQFSHKQY